MIRTIEEIISAKPGERLGVYACAIADKAHASLLKVWQTNRDVKQHEPKEVKP